ncbi:MAG: hypothetical protein C0598_07100 [Marinilabiliales bacterium]|nr:MAG: hypothetical protein C0598_07100 [Marinilabiliales bacterium]
MTEKQRKILDTALELFALEGYNSISTKKIAQGAGVSEGLIFKHFGSKEGLLDYLVEEGVELMNRELDTLMQISDASERLRATLRFPKTIIDRNPAYWKVQISIKFANHEIKEKYHNSSFMGKAMGILNDTFDELNFENPQMETQLLMQIIGSFFMALVNDEIENYDEMLSFLEKKYNLK